MIANLKNRLYGLLRLSERYIKTDMVYLFHGGFWLTLGQAVSSLSALALAVAFANLVPPETYGTYKYVLSIAGMFAIFTLPGINIAIARSSAQGNEAIIHSATRERVLYALIGSVLALLGSGYYFLNNNLELATALLIIAATLPVFDTFTTYLSHFSGKRRFDLQTKYHLIAQVITIPLLIVAIYFTNNILIILLAYFLPLIIVRGALYWFTVKNIPKETDTAQEKESITYGKHLTAMQILGVVSGQIDKILIWKFLGPAQLAVYTFALAIPEQIKGTLKGVGELAFPKFAAQTPEQIRANIPALWRKLALYALGLFGISFLYILTAPYIFALLFPQYIESVIYSQIFALSIPTNVSSIALAILTAQRKTQVQYVVTTIHPLMTIGLLLTLVPLYGVAGAIAAFIIAKFIATVIYLSSLFTVT